MAEIPVIDPDEIIPPGGRRAGDGTDGGGSGQARVRGFLPAMLAKLLDEFLRIPGTNIRIGLDPLLSFIPVIGDALATGAGAGILLAGIRHGAPLRVLGRMSGNLVMNAVINVVPLAGPVLSVWFRSNSRNNTLLQDHLAGAPPGPPSAQSRILIGALITLVVLLVAMSFFMWVSVYRFLTQLFG